MPQYIHSELSEKIIAASYQVHKELGCGFLEKVYKNALAIELEETSVKCAVEVPLKVLYRGKIVGDYYSDMVVDDKIIVEIRAVAEIQPV